MIGDGEGAVFPILFHFWKKDRRLVLSSGITFPSQEALEKGTWNYHHLCNTEIIFAGDPVLRIDSVSQRESTITRRLISLRRPCLMGMTLLSQWVMFCGNEENAERCRSAGEERRRASGSEFSEPTR